MPPRAPVPHYLELDSPELAPERPGFVGAEFVATITSVATEAFPLGDDPSSDQQRFVRLSAEAGLQDPELWTITLQSEAGSSTLRVGSTGSALPLVAGDVIRNSADELLFWSVRTYPNSLAKQELAPNISWRASEETCTRPTECFPGLSQYSVELNVEGRTIPLSHGQALEAEPWVAVHGRLEHSSGDIACTDTSDPLEELSLWRVRP